VSEAPSIYDLSLADLQELVETWGEPAYRARQIWHGLYRRLADGPESLTDLPLKLRRLISQTLSFSAVEPKRHARSKDGATEKVLLGLSDGRTVEAVLMRYDRRRTACISSQAGCALGCVFCATGQMGFERNLSVGEIVEQVLYFARRLARNGRRLTNLVVMGMGEPFHNYEATMGAIDRLTDPKGFKFGSRRITISTVGLVPMIERFTQERRQVNLAVSLHAATNELRQTLLPINRRYPLEQLIPACRRYVERTGRRISFEWALIGGVNDGLEQAQALAELIEGLTCHVNLIPLNPTSGFAGRTAAVDHAEGFKALLTRRGIACTIRLRRGIDIKAGCGQLATEEEGSGVSPSQVGSGCEARPV
jgi:23S rRNA (adenine2503-C2)-methyltransferase